MTKLGIIGAMQVEVEILLGQMDNKTARTVAGSEFCEGTLEGVDVVVVQCGVGKVNAALCAQILSSCFGVTHLVNTGIAGSLSAALDIGDLVVSEDAMYHDFDCVHFGYPYGRVPGMDVTAFPADETLARFAFEAAEAVNPGHIRMGRIASGDKFVAEKDVKDAIIAATGGLCTEMEGAAISHGAWLNHVPFVIIRAISDKADDSAHMDYPAFEKAAADHSAKLVEDMIQNL